MNDIFELRRLEKWFKKYNTSSIDYSYKSRVISSYNPEILNSVRKTQRQLSYRGIDTDFSARDYMYNTFGFISVLESYRINNAYNHRINRLRRRIFDMICKPDCVFLTFTFSDSSFLSTSSISRRRYVVRFLKKHCLDYVANIDYGEKNGREHYHAVVNLKQKIKPDDWKYGCINFERVNRVDKTDLLLSKYVSKLTNHAIKESTKRSSLIYPKNNK